MPNLLESLWYTRRFFQDPEKVIIRHDSIDISAANPVSAARHLRTTSLRTHCGHILSFDYPTHAQSAEEFGDVDHRLEKWGQGDYQRWGLWNHRGSSRKHIHSQGG